MSCYLSRPQCAGAPPRPAAGIASQSVGAQFRLERPEAAKGGLGRPGVRPARTGGGSRWRDSGGCYATAEVAPTAQHSRGGLASPGRDHLVFSMGPTCTCPQELGSRNAAAATAAHTLAAVQPAFQACTSIVLIRRLTQRHRTGHPETLDQRAPKARPPL